MTTAHFHKEFLSALYQHVTQHKWAPGSRSPAGASREGRERSWQLSMVIRILWREGCFPELKFLHTCLLESQIWDSTQGAKVKYFSDQWSESMMWSWEKISQGSGLENPSGMIKTCALSTHLLFQLAFKPLKGQVCHLL